MIHAAPYINEVFEVRTEDGVVHTALLGEDLRLTVGMSHHHLLIGSTIGVGREIGVARLLIIAIHVIHHITVFHNLSDQLTVQVVEIEMVITIALTGQEDMLVGDLHLFKCLFLDILVDLVFDSQLTYR